LDPPSAAGERPLPSEGGTLHQAGAPVAAGAPSSTGGAPHGSSGAAAGGEPGAGAGGEAQAGSGGEAGAPITCCDPLDCSDILQGQECGTNRYSDGCGKTFRCDCANDLVCEAGSCVACDPGPDPCGQDPLLCGETRDSCGDVVTCPDNCAALAAGACHSGRCCSPSKTECADDDCGLLLVGCGQTLDCRGNDCPVDTACQPNGKCCQPSGTCELWNCGYVPDGCGNYVDCGSHCGDDEVCLDNECVTSQCMAKGLYCGQTYNAEFEGLEHCGLCPESVACLDNSCVPFCAP
jgi:hypothetical protein